MSRDYKIGIVVGLLLLIAGLTYFLWPKAEEPVDQPGQQPEQVVNRPSEPARPAIPPVVEPRVTIPPREPVAVREPAPRPFDSGVSEVPETSSTGSGRDILDDTGTERRGPRAAEWDLPTRGGASEDDAGEVVVGVPSTISVPTTVGVPAAPARDETEATGPSWAMASDAADAYVEAEPAPRSLRTVDRRRSGVPPVPRVSPLPPTEPSRDVRRIAVGEPAGTTPPTTTPRSYICRGDERGGYWDVAERVWGREYRRFFQKIEQANPSIPATRLRKGAELKIPPRPELASSTSTGGAGRTRPGYEHGSIQVDRLTRKRIYIVSEADTRGMSGIAAREDVYGNGNLYGLIQKANPDVDPTKLRPGDKLVIPDRPASTSSTSTTRASAGTTPTRDSRHGQVVTEGGRRYYIVARGDNGFWGIAEKQNVYGSGAYMDVLRQGNPGLDSGRLKPGDKVYVPPKPARAPTSVGTSTRTPRVRTSSPIEAGVPDFGD